MTFVKATQSPATAENEKWLRSESSKTQNPVGVDSGSVTTSD